MTREEVLEKLEQLIKAGTDRQIGLAGSLRRMVEELDGQTPTRQAVVLSVLGASLEASQLREQGCSNLLFSVAVLLTVGEESLAGCLLSQPMEVAMHRLETKSRLARKGRSGAD